MVILSSGTFTCSETEPVWLSQKFPNFNAENGDVNGNGVGNVNGNVDGNVNGDSVGNVDHSNRNGFEDRGNDKKDVGNKKGKGGKKGDDGAKRKGYGASRRDYDANRKDGSWTFPYYSCNHQAWLASLVIPIRADNRSSSSSSLDGIVVRIQLHTPSFAPAALSSVELSGNRGNDKSP